MRRIRSTQLAILALVFAASLVAGLMVSLETSAEEGCACVGILRQSPIVQGSGTTCTAAYNNAKNAAWVLAANACDEVGGTGACLVDFIVTSGCSFSGGQWHLSGYATTRCRHCFR